MRTVTLFVLFCSCFFSCFAEDQRIDEILTFWFGELQGPLDYPTVKTAMWFNGGEEVDQLIREKFHNHFELAFNDDLDEWTETPRGRLALILILDQFSRNMFRGEKLAFAFDTKARELALEGIARGDDLQLFPAERLFLYLPLEHAENLQLQELSVEKFTDLMKNVDPSLTAIFESYQRYAVRHWEIIAQFGRFPHRNTILGRDSTPEEVDFLNTPNSSF